MTSPHWIRTFACVIPIGLSGLACAGSPSSRDGFTPRPTAQRVVVITNDHWDPVNVYHVRGGVRFRLGTVYTTRTEIFRLPDYADVDGTLRLLIDPVGSGNSYLTDRIIVGLGQSVIFRVRSRLAMSSWFVRD